MEASGVVEITGDNNSVAVGSDNVQWRPGKMNALVRDIEAWARARGLHEGDVLHQCAKLFEEGGEVARACIREDKPEIADGIGDCFVVLTILAMRNGLNIEECIEAAYNEIKGRKGKMVGGVFIREVNGVEVKT